MQVKVSPTEPPSAELLSSSVSILLELFSKHHCHLIPLKTFSTPSPEQSQSPSEALVSWLLFGHPLAPLCLQPSTCCGLSGTYFPLPYPCRTASFTTKLQVISLHWCSSSCILSSARVRYSSSPAPGDGGVLSSRLCAPGCM